MDRELRDDLEDPLWRVWQEAVEVRGLDFEGAVGAVEDLELSVEEEELAAVAEDVFDLELYPLAACRERMKFRMNSFFKEH